LSAASIKFAEYEIWPTDAERRRWQPRPRRVRRQAEHIVDGTTPSRDDDDERDDGELIPLADNNGGNQLNDPLDRFPYPPPLAVLVGAAGDGPVETTALDSGRQYAVHQQHLQRLQQQQRQRLEQLEQRGLLCLTTDCLRQGASLGEAPSLLPAPPQADCCLAASELIRDERKAALAAASLALPSVSFASLSNPPPGADSAIPFAELNNNENVDEQKFRHVHQTHAHTLNLAIS
jgi:hypothetical protein